MKTRLLFLSFSFFTLSYSAKSQEDSTQTFAATLIERMDQNGDGGVSEFEARVEVLRDFKIIDKNKDLFIDEQEMQVYLDYRTKKANRDNSTPCYYQLISPFFE